MGPIGLRELFYADLFEAVRGFAHGAQIRLVSYNE